MVSPTKEIDEVALNRIRAVMSKLGDIERIKEHYFDSDQAKQH